MKSRKILSKSIVWVLLLLCPALSATAQEQAGTSSGDSWYVGVGGGGQFSSLRYSNLDESRFPEKKSLSSPIFSVFVEKDFGREGNFVVRPQLSFLKRGGTLTDIGKFGGYTDPTVNDVKYRLKAHYLDLRIPLLYQFGRKESAVRPYAGIVPALSFALGGNARVLTEHTDYAVDGYQVDLNSKNFASTMFSISPTLGVRFNFSSGSHGQNKWFAAVEAYYEIGLSDTYGSDEKNGNALDVIRKAKYKIEGTRKLSGFGFQVSLGIPFGAFKKHTATPQPPIEPPTIIEQPIEKPEKPCYSLEEIEFMMQMGENVRGKTICSISDINFEFGKSNIQPSSYDYLNRLAETLMRTGANIEVKGHTDNVGTDERNIKLSKARAETVMKYLIKHGVSRDKISCTFYGASRPLTDNDSETGRALNRRVEFEILN